MSADQSRLRASLDSLLRVRAMPGRNHRRALGRYDEKLAVEHREDQAMTLTIAGATFDQHEYDDRGDVLYLSVGPPREAVRTIATPEGHAVDYDETGAVIGITLVNVQLLLDRDGMLTLSLPPVHIAAEALAPVLVAG